MESQLKLSTRDEVIAKLKAIALLLEELDADTSFFCFQGYEVERMGEIPLSEATAIVNRFQAILESFGKRTN